MQSVVSVAYVIIESINACSIRHFVFVEIVFNFATLAIVPFFALVILFIRCTIPGLVLPSIFTNSPSSILFWQISLPSGVSLPRFSFAHFFLSFSCFIFAFLVPICVFPLFTFMLKSVATSINTFIFLAISLNSSVINVVSSAYVA